MQGADHIYASTTSTHGECPALQEQAAFYTVFANTPQCANYGGYNSMAHIAGVDLPREKRVEIGLTYVFGIGRKTSSRSLLRPVSIRIPALRT